MCICIGDYVYADYRVTNAFKMCLIKIIQMLIRLRRIATRFADIWSTLLAEVRHVAPTNGLCQRTTKGGQFDISTSMLFVIDPKYHVQIVNGLKNHLWNTMFGYAMVTTPSDQAKACPWQGRKGQKTKALHVRLRNQL